MGRPGVIIYFEWMNALGLFDDAELGKIVRAIVDYCRFGVVPEFDTREFQLLWATYQPKLDADQRSYNARVERARKAAYAKWDKQAPSEPCAGMPMQADALQAWETDTETEKETETETDTDTEIDSEIYDPATDPFIPPTTHEVMCYCIMNNYYAFHQQFMDYYNANGWKIGKRPMKNWKAAVDWWQQRELEYARAREEE